MRNYLTTINYDLQGLKKILLEGSSSPSFNSVSVFSLFRDICIALNEANNVLKSDGVIDSDFPNMKAINEIRQKIKTDQGQDNRKVFKKMMNMHIDYFGEDIDNLGFYLDEDILAGSTLFPSFIFIDVDSLDIFDRNSVLSFTSFIGSLMQEVINEINQPMILDSKPIKVFNEEGYHPKDIWNQRFFTQDIAYNVFLTRLNLIQSELTTCTWLENHLDYKSSKLTHDKYILLRLTSIKLYEVMRNLLSIKSRLERHWKSLNLNILDDLLKEYKITFEGELKKLRDMHHYDNKGENFYDYIDCEIGNDPNYADKLINIIFNDYIHKVRNAISATIDIQSYDSMSESEMIERRIESRFYQDE